MGIIVGAFELHQGTEWTILNSKWAGAGRDY